MVIVNTNFFLAIFAVFAVINTLLAASLSGHQLSSTVPRINEEFHEVVPNDQGYRLRIFLPDGTVRDEIVQFSGTPEEELTVKGSLIEVFKDTQAQAMTLYEAGKNGYTIKYKYEKTDAPMPVILDLSPNSLKSLTG